MDLQGKVAIITGSGTGIGRRMAMDLAANGCSVVIASNVQEEVNEVYHQVQQSGGEALPLCLDLSNEEDIQQMISSSVERFGHIDILINNAGVFHQKEFPDVTTQEWDRVMNINLKAHFFISQSVMNLMKERHNGYIINMGSSVIDGKVHADRALYSIAKHAVIGLSKVLRDEGGKYGIKVSTIYPSRTDTQMSRNITYASVPETWLLPEDISDCVLFLLRSNERCIINDLHADIFAK
jgi:NAD(P)-dependent dehydrogenase (short-subunit alcohol dehydrogenase family)